MVVYGFIGGEIKTNYWNQTEKQHHTTILTTMKPKENAPPLYILLCVENKQNCSPFFKEKDHL